jgi:hypothetical protein
MKIDRRFVVAGLPIGRDLVGHVQVPIRTTQVVFRRGQFTNQRSSG